MSMIVRDIGQSIPEFLPKELVAPLQVEVGLQIEPDVWIKVLLRHLSQQDHDESASSVAQHLMVGRLELEPAPLGLDKVVRQNHNSPLGRVHGLHYTVCQKGAHWIVPVVQTQFVVRLQRRSQHLGHPALVLRAVAHEGVKEFVAIVPLNVRGPLEHSDAEL